uniref:Uncharacterized protein n=1 Tax=Knipowitschia caucasica TaxID=637954 RepID=A0AAV2K3H2_KNICA
MDDRRRSSVEGWHHYAGECHTVHIKDRGDWIGQGPSGGMANINMIVSLCFLEDLDRQTDFPMAPSTALFTLGVFRPEVLGCGGTRLRWCPAAVVPGCGGTRLRWCPAAVVPGCGGARLRWCPAAVVPGCGGAGCGGARLRWHPAAVVPGCGGTRRK